MTASSNNKGNYTRWRAALRSTIRESREDALTDRAAALTYYAVLSIFPALLTLLSVVGLVGTGATDPLLDQLSGVTPGSAGDVLRDVVMDLDALGSGAIGLVAVSFAGAVWAASGYVGAFMRAANVINEVDEGRSFMEALPVRIGTTLGLLGMLALLLLGVTVTGDLAGSVGDLLGVGAQTVAVWQVVKWPVIVVVAMLMLAVLYWAAPNVRRPFRFITPGAIVGVLLWMLASGAFAVYVGNFSSYNRTYGALAGVISFLVWLWVSNLAILIGAELDAELARENTLDELRSSGLAE